MTLKIGALTKLGLFFAVVCFIHVFDQTLAEQLYCDKGLYSSFSFPSNSAGPPMIKKVTKHFIGQTKVLCEVEYSHPLPKLQWFYKPLVCSSDKQSTACHYQKTWENIGGDYIVSPPFSEPTLRSELAVPSRIEEGLYNCTAKNRFGKDSHQMVFSRQSKLNR